MSKRALQVGGQAVLSGVMMRSRRWWAVAVRRPDGGIHVESHPTPRTAERRPALDKPFLRGALALAESMSIGMRALAISARHSGKTEEAASEDQIGTSVALAFVFFVALFIVVPALLVRGGTDLPFVYNLADGLVRIGILIGYILLISRRSDVQKLFRYHGAEHKVIAAFESGDPPTMAGARPYPTVHLRCGTNFLVLLMLVALVVFLPLARDPWWWRIGARILLLPLVAGLAFELLRLGARRDRNPLVRLLTFPGRALQRITTKEPDDEQLEVAAAAFAELREREGWDEPDRGPGGPGPEAA